MKKKFLQLPLIIASTGLLIFCLSFKNKNEVNTFHQNSELPTEGYVPSTPGTQLTYHIHSVVGGESSDAEVTATCFGVLDSMAWFNAKSSYGSASMIAMVNSTSTTYPAMPHEEFTKMVNMMKSDKDAITTGSNGYVWANFPNNATVGSPITIQYPNQYFKVKSKDQLLDVKWTFHNGVVSALEKIKTPAGIFDCIKASYSYNVVTHQTFPGFDKTTKVICTRTFWLCKGVGNIKLDTDAKNSETGSLISHSHEELIKINISKKGTSSGAGDSTVHKSGNLFTIGGGEYGSSTSYTLSNDKKNASGLLADGRITATIKDAIVTGNNKDEITIVLDFPTKSPASYTLPDEAGDNEATIEIIHYQGSKQINTHNFTVSSGTLKITSVDKKMASGSFDFKSTDADATGVDANYHLKGNFKVALVSL